MKFGIYLASLTTGVGLFQPKIYVLLERRINMKFLKVAILILTLSISSLSFADEFQSTTTSSHRNAWESDLYPFQPYLKGGGNVISTPNMNLRTNKFQFLLGVGTDYYLDKNWGVFGGVEYNQRGRKFLNTTLSSASYLDVPFGLTLPYGEGFWRGNSFSTLHVGPYIAFPLSNFKYDYPYSAQSSVPYREYYYQPKPDAQTYGGLYVDNDIMFSTSSTVAPGLTTWMKLPLGSAVNGTNTRFYEFGLGLKVNIF